MKKRKKGKVIPLTGMKKAEIEFDNKCCQILRDEENGFWENYVLDPCGRLIYFENSDGRREKIVYD